MKRNHEVFDITGTENSISQGIFDMFTRMKESLEINNYAAKFNKIQ